MRIICQDEGGTLSKNCMEEAFMEAGTMLNMLVATGVEGLNCMLEMARATYGVWV